MTQNTTTDGGYPVVRYQTAKGDEREGRVISRPYIASDGNEYVTVQPMKGRVWSVRTDRLTYVPASRLDPNDLA